MSSVETTVLKLEGGEGAGEGVGVGVGVDVGLGDGVGVGKGVGVGELATKIVPLVVNVTLQDCEAEFKGSRDARSVMAKREITTVFFEFSVPNAQS